MRRSGLWHPTLLAELTRMGHGDTLVLADVGLPIPAGPTLIELVWSRNEPRLAPLLRAIMSEFVFERATVADDLSSEASPDWLSELGDLPIMRVPHEGLKAMTSGATLIVRTGEVASFANVILHSGVDF